MKRIAILALATSLGLFAATAAGAKESGRAVQPGTLFSAMPLNIFVVSDAHRSAGSQRQGVANDGSRSRAGAN